MTLPRICATCAHYQPYPDNQEADWCICGKFGEASRISDSCDMYASAFAAGPWRTDEPPKDGSAFLAGVRGGFLVLCHNTTGYWWTDGYRGYFAADIRAWAPVNPPPEPNDDDSTTDH